MKATGIVRRIDDLGRVVIPKEMRKMLKIEDYDALEIFTTDSGQVVLQKYHEEDMPKNGFADDASAEHIPITIKDEYNERYYYLNLSPSANELLNWLILNDMMSCDYTVEDGHNFETVDF